MSKRKAQAVYAGSFDPPTLGHINIIKRAAAIFGELHVVIAQNNAKKYLLPIEERISLMEELCLKLKNVKVAAASSFVTGYMAAEKIDILVRSLRNIDDYNSETAMASWNKALYPKAETLFLAADPGLAHISSTGVKEVIMFGGDFSAFVPPIVYDVLTKKIKSGMIILSVPEDEANPAVDAAVKAAEAKAAPVTRAAEKQAETNAAPVPKAAREAKAASTGTSAKAASAAKAETNAAPKADNTEVKKRKRGRPPKAAK